MISEKIFDKLGNKELIGWVSGLITILDRRVRLMRMNISPLTKNTNTPRLKRKLKQSKNIYIHAVLVIVQ